MTWPVTQKGSCSVSRIASGPGFPKGLLLCSATICSPEKHGDIRFTAGQYSKDTLDDKWPAWDVEDSEKYAGKLSKKKSTNP